MFSAFSWQTSFSFVSDCRTLETGHDLHNRGFWRAIFHVLLATRNFCGLNVASNNNNEAEAVIYGTVFIGSGRLAAKSHIQDDLKSLLRRAFTWFIQLTLLLLCLE